MTTTSWTKNRRDIAKEWRTPRLSGVMESRSVKERLVCMTFEGIKICGFYCFRHAFGLVASFFLQPGGIYWKRPAIRSRGVTVWRGSSRRQSDRGRKKGRVRKKTRREHFCVFLFLCSSLFVCSRFFLVRALASVCGSTPVRILFLSLFFLLVLFCWHTLPTDLWVGLHLTKERQKKERKKKV